MSAPSLDATVLIATYNRADLLGETIDSLKCMRVSPRLRWELVVIDNNSTDETRAVAERHLSDFPVPHRCLFEPRQGRSSALNTGIAAAAGRVLAFTDDDVRVADGWLDAACDALLGPDESIAYAGGPVRPIWEVPAPVWFDLTRGDLWGTIAILDHGSKPFVFEEARRVPLGANMAARRALFERVGGFRPDLGRSGGRLVLGQEVPELLIRARAAGFRGLYLPAMAVDHHIPARRLTPAYFRRWWFGKGVSRAALDRMQRVTDMGVDLERTPHVLRVPRYMYGSALRDTIGLVRNWLGTRPADAFRHQMMLAYFAGYFYARQVERQAKKTGTMRDKSGTAIAA
jgi:glycosyltransferase involved in cell wall biosynthesis